MIRLLRAYAKGQYRAIAWESLLLIAAGLIYLVSPIDVIPDFLPAGLVDDGVVLAFVLTLVLDELEDFRKWELRQSTS